MKLNYRLVPVHVLCCSGLSFPTVFLSKSLQIPNLADHIHDHNQQVYDGIRLENFNSVSLVLSQAQRTEGFHAIVSFSHRLRIGMWRTKGDFSLSIPSMRLANRIEHLSSYFVFKYNKTRRLAQDVALHWPPGNTNNAQMTSSKICNSVPTLTFDAVVIHCGMLRRGWCPSMLQWPAEYGVIIDFAARRWHVSMVDD
jgi:hypothetical protein